MERQVILNFDTPAIKHLCEVDKQLAKVINMIGPLRYIIHDDPYEFLIHEIIEQMLSAKAGNKIFQRLVDLCEGKITPMKINCLSDEQIKSIGTANSKVRFIRNLTNLVISEEIDLYDLMNQPQDVVYNELTSIHGIGNWTANMFLIFVMDCQDVLPVDDAAFLQGYCWLNNTADKSKKNVNENCKKWKPYSSIASRYLYKALDSGFTKSQLT